MIGEILTIGGEKFEVVDVGTSYTAPRKEGGKLVGRQPFTVVRVAQCKNAKIATRADKKG